MKDLNPDEYENPISLNIVSLFTNVELANAISLATEKMSGSDFVEPSPIQENTFETKVKLVSIDVRFSDRSGTLCRQSGGVSMLSTLAPLLSYFFSGPIR